MNYVWDERSEQMSDWSKEMKGEYDRYEDDDEGGDCAYVGEQRWGQGVLTYLSGSSSFCRIRLTEMSRMMDMSADRGGRLSKLSCNQTGIKQSSMWPDDR